MAVVRAFVDTNVLISGTFFGGPPRHLLDLGRAGRLRVVVSMYVLAEFIRATIRPGFGYPQAKAEDLAAEIAEFAEVVPHARPRASWCRDPADNPVIEAALLGEADVLVTGDRALLATEVPGLRIVTPAVLVAELGE
ncbi:MAG: putative toxin-antitoxin system toxin component, PIN family [Coriobacteriaceae bacterium]|nr:putative toxin-antitoxin system toxin component, PIN family [Coriobacteriaceae bacterium]